MTASAFYAHLNSCVLCAQALAEHDAQAPACGDRACSRVALCVTGAALRESYLDPADQEGESPSEG